MVMFDYKQWSYFRKIKYGHANDLSTGEIGEQTH